MIVACLQPLKVQGEILMMLISLPIVVISSIKCQKIEKNGHQDFLKTELTYSNSLFCTTTILKHSLQS